MPCREKNSELEKRKVEGRLRMDKHNRDLGGWERNMEYISRRFNA
jgi:hypothetical protein